MGCSKSTEHIFKNILKLAWILISLNKLFWWVAWIQVVAIHDLQIIHVNVYCTYAHTHVVIWNLKKKKSDNLNSEHETPRT